MNRWIYTLRTKDDMGVFYVGACNHPHDRVNVHKSGKSRPVSIHIRKLLDEGREVITVFEEHVCDGRLWHFIEAEYIAGYAKLIGDRLMNVQQNPLKRKKAFVFANAATEEEWS